MRVTHNVTTSCDIYAVQADILIRGRSRSVSDNQREVFCPFSRLPSPPLVPGSPSMVASPLILMSQPFSLAAAMEDTQAYLAALEAGSSPPTAADSGPPPDAGPSLWTAIQFPSPLDSTGLMRGVGGPGELFGGGGGGWWGYSSRVLCVCNVCRDPGSTVPWGCCSRRQVLHTGCGRMCIWITLQENWSSSKLPIHCRTQEQHLCMPLSGCRKVVGETTGWIAPGGAHCGRVGLPVWFQNFPAVLQEEEVAGVKKRALQAQSVGITPRKCINHYAGEVNIDEEISYIMLAGWKRMIKSRKCSTSGINF